ncbi:hypothetical protein [Planococcus chinensis]|uniref:RCK C-terminal domain-containing protein n=1 Tax=Planococcus chinensis TaxID=272917 RepID=A0ABW4QDK0_9BACL
MGEVLFILLYSTIMWLVIEIAVVLFVYTGLNKQIARYQVISMLTATGFTTDESSLIIDHPIRRKISAGVILFGYFSLAVMISSIAALLSNDLRVNLLGMIILVFFAILLVLRNRRVTALLTDKFEHDMDMEYDLEDWPLKTALGLKDNDMVAMLEIVEGSDYENAASENLLMRDDDIHLLFIRRGNVILRKSLFQVKLLAGDRVMVFGDEKTIKEKFGDMLTEDAR